MGFPVFGDGQDRLGMGHSGLSGRGVPTKILGILKFGNSLEKHKEWEFWDGIPTFCDVRDHLGMEDLGASGGGLPTKIPCLGIPRKNAKNGNSGMGFQLFWMFGIIWECGTWNPLHMENFGRILCAEGFGNHQIWDFLRIFGICSQRIPGKIPIPKCPHFFGSFGFDTKKFGGGFGI